MLQQTQPLPFFQAGSNFMFWAREPKPTFFPIPKGAHTIEWYCQSGGSNLNSGSDTNNTAKYTSTNGNWNGSNIFIPTDGSAPSGTVQKGDWASIYVDGSTGGTYVAQVLNVVDGVNGTITFAGGIGVPPSSSATTRTIKVGGAWKGPVSGNNWPLLTNYNWGDGGRVNFKNDQTYVISNQAQTSGFLSTYQGYSVVPGDGGKCTFDNSTFNGSMFNTSSGYPCFIDCIFQGTTGAASNQGHNGNGFFLRCVFHDFGFCGLQINTGVNGTSYILDCEFYKVGAQLPGNTALAVHVSGSGNCAIRNCYFHDNPYGGALLRDTGSIEDCIFDSIVGVCIGIYDNTTGTSRYYKHCTFYNITGYCIESGGVSSLRRIYAWNCLAVNCSTFLGCTTVAQTIQGHIYNCAYYNVGSRIIKAGGSGGFSALLEFGTKTLPSNPFNAPATGDFTLLYGNPAAQALICAGRADFTQTGSGKSGTLSYPDIGAVSHLDLGSIAIQLSSIIDPFGYLTKVYTIQQTFPVAVVVTMTGGTLPTGLTLSQPDGRTMLITGTPTAVGTYFFTLRVSYGGAYIETNCGVTILAAPAGGGSFVGGG